MIDGDKGIPAKRLPPVLAVIPERSAQRQCETGRDAARLLAAPDQVVTEFGLRKGRRAAKRVAAAHNGNDENDHARAGTERN
ncbi:MAG: hypothetical protein F4X97_13880 [Boseongicola sp. SB0662_bin_57]|nr:hypothetical protein [Boseongicola sp. SB0662_bin_57]